MADPNAPAPSGDDTDNAGGPTTSQWWDLEPEPLGVDRPGTAESSGSTPSEDGPAPAVARFASLPLFVEQFVIVNWARRLSDSSRWCATWWQHAEAVLRLEAMWEAFEVMRREPAPALSLWIRDHFDVHMRALTAIDGVFWRCEAESRTHEAPPTWPTEPAPQGQFATDATAQIQPAPAARTVAAVHAGAAADRVSTG